MRKKMTTEKILELVEDYYKMEYKDIQLVAKHHRMKDYFKLSVSSTLSRCLGVALFVQSMDVPYDDITKLYDDYRKKIEKVLDND